MSEEIKNQETLKEEKKEFGIEEILKFIESLKVLRIFAGRITKDGELDLSDLEHFKYLSENYQALVDGFTSWSVRIKEVKDIKLDEAELIVAALIEAAKGEDEISGDMGEEPITDILEMLEALKVLRIFAGRVMENGKLGVEDLAHAQYLMEKWVVFAAAVNNMGEIDDQIKDMKFSEVITVINKFMEVVRGE